MVQTRLFFTHICLLQHKSASYATNSPPTINIRLPWRTSTFHYTYSPFSTNELAFHCTESPLWQLYLHGTYSSLTTHIRLSWYKFASQQIFAFHGTHLLFTVHNHLSRQRNSPFMTHIFLSRQPYPPLTATISSSYGINPHLMAHIHLSWHILALMAHIRLSRHILVFHDIRICFHGTHLSLIGTISASYEINPP